VRPASHLGRIPEEFGQKNWREEVGLWFLCPEVVEIDIDRYLKDDQLGLQYT
jgi:hypothetical protein